jgi:hypothetical protein
MIRSLWIALLLAGSVSSSSALAQVRDVPQCQVGLGVPTLPRLQGFVQDADEKGIAGARLDLVKLRPDGSEERVLQTETTDPKGHFRFKRYKDEIYAVRVTVGDRKFEELKLRQGSTAMLPGGGLMNFVLLVEQTPCIGLSLTR